jgi:glycosyltransferase involved in cell wall biosynthesis
MRIALLPSAYAPAVGGVEVLSARLAHALTERGHDVEVWAAQTSTDGYPAVDTVDGIPVRRFVFPMPGASLRDLAGTAAGAVDTLRLLRRATDEFRPDLLHVLCFSGNGAYASLLSRRSAVPLVVTLQGETVMDDQAIYQRSVVMRTALRLALRRSTAVTGCSRFTLDDAHTHYGLDPAKAHVVFNGIDLDEATPARLDIPFARFVLALGRVVPNKGFDLLLEAFRRVAHDRVDDPRDGLDDLGLVVAGDGPHLDRLRRLTSEHGLDGRVHFAGRADRAQVAWLMGHAEVFVMPSRVEPFGIVALEAWRAGTPLVATTRGGPPEFVEHDRTGLLADPFDADALAGAIRRLLTDSALRGRITAGATDRLREFTWDRIAEQYERLYQRSGVRAGTRVGRDLAQGTSTKR